VGFTSELIKIIKDYGIDTANLEKPLNVTKFDDIPMYIQAYLRGEFTEYLSLAGMLKCRSKIAQDGINFRIGVKTGLIGGFIIKKNGDVLIECTTRPTLEAMKIDGTPLLNDTGVGFSIFLKTNPSNSAKGIIQHSEGIWVKIQINRSNLDIVTEVLHSYIACFNHVFLKSIVRKSGERSSLKGRADNYIPTKDDCERVIKKISISNIETEVNFVDFLTELEKDLTEKGITLKRNWRVITEANLKLWSS